VIRPLAVSLDGHRPGHNRSIEPCPHFAINRPFASRESLFDYPVDTREKGFIERDSHGLGGF
jgi:hypothetical protein